MKEYNVIGFRPKLQGGLFGGASGLPIEKQVQEAIASQAAAGWAFESYQSCHYEVAPGCLGALFGAKTVTMTYDIMIFSRG